MTKIPSPDTAQPEYDAPPPANTGSIQTGDIRRYPKRPASKIVNNPSEKPAVIAKG